MLCETILRNTQHVMSSRLNPYSNGICSVSRGLSVLKVRSSPSLNPYSNGICSVRLYTHTIGRIGKDCLNPYSNGICSVSLQVYVDNELILCLNPYSNGICSVSLLFKHLFFDHFYYVLILILMEYAL